jgi:branched-chain amino acid transport system substrate-binding protein
MDSPNKAVDGVRGQVYFDTQHNFSQPPTFGMFEQGNFIPAPVQLRPVANKKLVTELTDSIIVDGNKYIYKTNVAYTGIRVNEITDVDVDKAHTFTADFYIWFRYQGDIDVSSIDFLNSVAPIKLGDPVSSSTQDGINYKLYRIRAPFHTTFDLQKYPFDTQKLAIEFRHRTLTREKLIYVEDALGMDHVTRGPDLLARLTSDGAFASVTDWFPTDPRIFIDVHSDKASFGNPALIGNQGSVENSTFNMKLDIHRNYPRFMLKNLLPLFCLVALAYVSLFLPGYKFESIISVMTGSVLSIVFFHVNLSNRLNVGYNVALDYVFYGTYMLFIIELMIVVIAWHHHQTDEKIAHKRMVFARAIYPLYLVVGGVYFLWTNIVPQGLPFARAVLAFLAG